MAIQSNSTRAGLPENPKVNNAGHPCNTQAEIVVSAYSVNHHKHQLTFPVLGLVYESAERFVGVQITYQGEWNCQYTIARVTKPPLTAEYRLTMAYLITYDFR